MSELTTQFQAATEASKALPERPDNDTLLKLYALYKQATAGDVTGKRPGMFDMVGRAKYDAWTQQEGVSTEEAMQAYVDLVESLQSA